MENINFKIDVECMQYTVFFSLNSTNKECKKLLKTEQYTPPFLYENYKMPKSTYINGRTTVYGPYALVQINSNNFINFVQTLTHELFHAVTYILRDKGMSLSDQSEEAYAYNLDHLMSRILKEVINQNEEWKKLI